ncbi:LacI family DNA-binding transcriptional regulator [Pseudovibrio flavus]|uniref:LacI family DNA-binding transcriptional regulator n=1 Tax=Pseudovibrio flavus TaxID=2529854 RepID=UPI0035287F94
MAKKSNKKVRLSDLAAYCGVSLSTASRAISGTPGVRPDLREKVLAAAKTLNYFTVNSISGSTIIVATDNSAMVDSQRNQFTTFVLQGIMERAAANNVNVITRYISSPSEERDIVKMVEREDSITGLLLLSMDDEETLSLARSCHKPVVLVNGDDPRMAISSIGSCNRSSAANATSYLCSLGHKDILFMAKRGRRTIEERIDGWRTHAFTAESPNWMNRFLNVSDWGPEAAESAMKAYLDKNGQNFTAVLCAGDGLAFGAVQALKRAGLQVPGDVSVVGMDGLPQGAFFDPPLTSSQIPMKEIGMSAVDMLRDQLSELERVPRRVELACRIVNRSSASERR